MFLSPSRTASRSLFAANDTTMSFDVGVNGVLPQILYDHISSSSSVLQSAATQRWYAIMTPDGVHVVYQDYTLTLPEQKEAVGVYRLAGMKRSNDKKYILKIIGTNNDQQCHVYVADQTSNTVMWWLIEKNNSSTTDNNAFANKSLDNVEAILPTATQTLELHAGEHITCLKVKANVVPEIVVGTSTGRLYYIVQSLYPTLLHASLIQDQAKSTSFISRLFGSSSPDVGNKISSSTDSTVNSNAVKQIVWLSSDKNDTNTTFAAISVNTVTTAWTRDSNSESSTGNFKRVHEPVDLVKAAVVDDTNSQANIPRLADATIVAAIADCNHSTDSGSKKTLLHCLIKTRHIPKLETRLYWICFEYYNGTDVDVPRYKLVHAHWLNRFYAPQHVQVFGISIATNTRVAYSVMRADEDAPCVVMAVDPVHYALYELELPQNSVPSVYKNTLVPDIVTNGCNVWTVAGTSLCIALDESLTRQSSAITPRRANLRTVAVLEQHLLDTFWNYYRDPGSNCVLPPSITEAKIENVQAAVVNVARALYDRIDLESTTTNPREWHWSLRTLLQQTGLYRQLSVHARWQLLAIAQRTAALWRLGNIHTEGSWETQQLSLLVDMSLEDWLQHTVDAALNDVNPDHRRIWIAWLCDALEAAKEVRTEIVEADKLDKYPPRLVKDYKEIAVWTSCEAVQTVLLKQIKFWSTNEILSNKDQILLILSSTLQSFADLHHACPESDTARSKYAETAGLTLYLWRTVETIQPDVKVWELAYEHCQFSVLCQLAFEHERKKDKDQYQLLPLFEEFGDKTDVKTKLDFGTFCLKWFLDRSRIGHVLRYGKYANTSFHSMLKTEPQLRPYRWVGAIQMGRYDEAAAYLLENVEIGIAKLSEAKMMLNCASLANQIAEEETPTIKAMLSQRSESIDKLRELVNAQELLDGEDGNEKAVLKTRDALLTQTLDELDDTNLTSDERLGLCQIALAICTTHELSQEVIVQAAKVWHKVISLDMDYWRRLFKNENVMSSNIRDEIVSRTMFGRMVQQCMENGTWGDALYKPQVEHRVMAQFEDSFASTMQRVFQVVVPAEWSQDEAMSTNDTATP